MLFMSLELGVFTWHRMYGRVEGRRGTGRCDLAGALRFR